MATITATATPVIKYSDTTDITLLLPADIAKFTEKDFALFTTQQQSDLSAAQVAPLTAKQIAALPLKLVEPDTIAAMTTAAVASFDLKSFTPDQFSALTSLQFKVLTTTQISVLTPAQVDLISLNQAAVLTADQLAAFSLKNVAMLNASIIEVLPTAAMTGFTTANIIGLTTDAIAALTTAQASTLTAKQIATLTPSLVSNLEAEDIAALSTNAVRGFSKVNISALDLSALSSDQFGALSSKQLGLLTTTQLETLTAESAPLLTSKSIAALTSAQLAILSTDIISALDPNAIKGFSVKNIVGLTTNQIAAINPEQSTILSKVQLKALLSSQVSALTVDSILAIKPIILKGLSSTLMQNFNPSVFASLTEVQIGSLTGAHIAGLTTAQTAGLTGAQLELIKAPVLASLTPANVSAISVDSVSALTTTQLGKFSTTSGGQLESLTPAQAAQLSSTVKDWVVAKNFALIQSSQTTNTVTTPSGIETSGTITGAARAETIISGAGNDIISTGSTTSTTGDSIDSGAGNDTITMTNATTGHRHSIAGGTGTDTLILAGAANYTSGDFAHISGIEKITLTVDATQTLDLGAGVTNAITTVTATALATDEKSLTLSGSANGVTVTISNANLLAPNYTGSLTIDASSSTTGTNVITTGSGADSINAGSGVDVITAGSGLDTMTGGAGADTFIFAAGANGAAPSASVFDTITDFSNNSDVIDFGATVLTISPTSAAVTTGTAKILPTGRAEFAEADDTLGERIAATENVLEGSTPTAGKSALFNFNGDSYVFISDGTFSSAGVTSSNDVLIKMSGTDGAAATSLGIKDGNITSVGSYNVSTFNGGTGLATTDTVYIVDTAANINAATTTLVTNIAKIDSITASDNLPIVLTPLQLATAGVAATLADGAATVVALTGDASNSANVTALITNIAKIAPLGISGIANLTPAQFTTASSKLAAGAAYVLADGSHVSDLVTNAAKIAPAHLTGTIALTATEFATSDVTTALANTTATVELTVASNGSQAGFIDALVASSGKIAAAGVTLSGGTLALTATQLNTVSTALHDAVATVAVSSPSVTEVGYLNTHALKITNDGITGSGLSLDESQFATLSAKINTSATNVTVDATGVTAGHADLTAIVSGIGKIDTLTTTAGTIPLSAAQFATTDVATKLVAGKATVALTTTSNGDESGFITALLASPTKIAATGVTLGAGGSLALTATGFATAGVVTALNTDVATISFASGTPSDVTAVSTLVANPTKIAANGITGTGLSLDEVQFSALRTKLSADIIDVTVDASSSSSSNVDDLITGIDRIGTINLGITNTGTLSVTDTQFKALQGKLDSAISSKITVDVTGASVDELAAVTANIGKIAAVTNLSLNVAQNATDITNLLGKAATGSVSVDPTNFDAAQITAINTAATKIATGGITKASATTIPLTATQFSTLVNKIGTNVTAVVDASGANATQIATMTTTANAKIAASNGVKGTGITLTAAQFNVLDTKLDANVTVTVNAAGSSFVDLENLSTNISKISSITGLSLALGTDISNGGTDANNTITENLLNKAVGASVNAAGATATELSSLFTHIGNVSSLSNSDFVISASQFAALQATLPTGSIIDATGATAAQLSLIAADIAGSSTKVGSIINLTLSLGSQSSTEASNLLTKAANNSVTTNITGANNINGTDYTGTLVTNASKFATGGLTGSNLSLTDTQFAALATKFASSVTDVIVDAASATASELAAISTNIARVGLVKNASIVATTQTDTETENLLSKSFGLDAVINANGASAAQMNSVVAHINKIAAASVTGASATLTVTPAQFTAITAKLTGSATVDATGANATQLSLLSTDAKAAALTHLTLSVSQSNTEMTALLGKVGVGEASAALISPSSAQIVALAAASTKLATAGLSGSGYAMDEVQFSTLATKFGAGVTTTVDATSGAVADLVTLSNNISHVGSISNLTLTAAGGSADLGAASMTDTVTANLLSKAVNGTAKVEATGASDAEIASLTTYANKLATGALTGSVGGVSGTLAVTDTQFATLHAKLDVDAIVTVNAAGATTGELTVLATNSTKVDTIKNLVVTAANQTDTETSTLLGKSEALKAKVVATGATTVEVTAFRTNIGQIDANGITGVLHVVKANDVDTANPPVAVVNGSGITALFGKYADGVATVDATAMVAAQLIAVSAVTGKIATGGITNLTAVANDLTDAQTANLLSKATGAAVTATSATSGEVASFVQYISNIAAAGIGGTLPITAGVAADGITNLFGKYSGTTATVDASGMNSAQITNVVTNAGKIGAGVLTNATLDEVQFATDVSGTKTVIAALANLGATVDATDAIAANAAIVLTNANLAKIATGGLSHVNVDLSDSAVVTAFGGASKDILADKMSDTLTITGSSGVDTINLTGYTDATMITAGGNSDVMTAGSGADTFIYTAISTAESGSAVGAGATTLPDATAGVDTITSFTTGVDKIALPAALGLAAASGTLVPTGGTSYTTSSVMLEAADFVSVAFATDAVATNTAGGARFIYDTVGKVLYFDPTGNTAISTAGAATAGADDDFAVVTTTGVQLVSTDFMFV